MTASVQMRIEQLKKQQESLKRESGAAVETWDNIMLRKQTMARTAHRKDIKAELKRCSQGLQRNIWETCKVGEVGCLSLKKTSVAICTFILCLSSACERV